MIHWPLRCLWIVAAVAILAECAQLPAQQQPAQQQPTEQSSSSEQPPVAQPPNGQPPPGSPVTGQQPAQSPVGSQGQQTVSSCSEIQDGLPFDKWRGCQRGTHRLNVIGDLGYFSVLDFSNIEENEITTFFNKANNQTELVAGIRIVGHQTLQTLNMEKVKKWSAMVKNEDANKIYIEIANNPKLKEIKLGLSKMNIASVFPIHILIYNNPSLNLTDQMVTLFKSATVAKGVILVEKNPGVCQFQHPVPNGNYFMPATDFLEKCEMINGDLDMEDVTLKKKITLNPTGHCLRLVNVSSLKENLDFPKFNNGSVECKHKKGQENVKSEIRGNPNICGGNLAVFEKFFPVDAGVIITPDSGTCTTNCTATQVRSIYDRCSSIKEDADISTWFTDKKLMENQEKLKSADGIILTIANTNATNLTLPNLEEAKGLIITNNDDLVDIFLPKLTALETLTMNGNVKLPLQRLNKWKVKVKHMENPTIECQAGAMGNEATTISEVEQFWHCQKFVGGLTLSGLKTDIPAGKLPLKEIAGCLIIEKTKLTNLDFLKNVAITCTLAPGKNVVQDNPDLCEPTFMKEKGKLTFTGGKTIGCGYICKTLKKGEKCITLQGDLTVTDAVTDEMVKDLEIIEGQFIMKGTKHVKLTFPKLVRITAKKAPAILVKDNSKLEELQIKDLKDATVADGKLPIIEISGNPALKFVDSFVPSSLLTSCSKDSKGKCYHAEHGDRKQSPGFGWWVFALIGAGVLIFCVTVVVIVCCLIRRHRNKAAKELDNPTKKDASKAGRKKSKQKSKTATSSDPKTTSAEKVKSADTSTSKTGAVSQTGETSKQTSPASGHKPPAGKKAAVVPAANHESGTNFVEKKISNIEGLKYFSDNAHLVLQELLHMVWTKRIDKTTPSGEKTGQWNDQKLTATGRLHALAVTEAMC